MDIQFQDILIFFHVLLFGYWLGADLGVFYCDSQLTRDDLSLDERLRVREIRKKVDMAPRTCVALILPIGFTLALPYGSPITGWWLGFIWIGSLSWLALLWAVRATSGTERGRILEKLDRVVWYSLALVMTVLGLYALIAGEPVAARWLALKIFLYGLMLLSATWILRAADHWQEIFDMVRAGGEKKIEGERRMKRNRVNAGAAAVTLWCLVLLIAFVGATKPL